MSNAGKLFTGDSPEGARLEILAKTSRDVAEMQTFKTQVNDASRLPCSITYH